MAFKKITFSVLYYLFVEMQLVDFWVFTLYLQLCKPQSAYWSYKFLYRFLGSFYGDILFLLFLFLALIAPALTCSTVLSNSNDNRYSCLVPDLKGKALRGKSFTIKLDFRYRFLADASYQTEEISFHF